MAHRVGYANSQVRIAVQSVQDLCPRRQENCIERRVHLVAERHDALRQLAIDGEGDMGGRGVLCGGARAFSW